MRQLYRRGDANACTYLYERYRTAALGAVRQIRVCAERQIEPGIGVSAAERQGS